MLTCGFTVHSSGERDIRKEVSFRYFKNAEFSLIPHSCCQGKALGGVGCFTILGFKLVVNIHEAVIVHNALVSFRIGSVAASG